MPDAIMPPTPLFLPDRPDLILPDRVEIMVDDPALRPGRPGRKRLLDYAWAWHVKNGPHGQSLGPDDHRRLRRGWGRSWMEGDRALQFHYGHNVPFALYVQFNPIRSLHRRLLEAGALKPGPTGPGERHGNAIHPEQLVGLAQTDLQAHAAREIAEVAAWASRRYRELLHERMGLPLDGPAVVGWNALQLARDIPLEQPEPTVLSYRDPVRRNLNPINKTAANRLAADEVTSWVAGRTFKFPTLVIYAKAGLVRAEINVDPKRIAQGAGSWLVPTDADAVCRQLQAVWVRHGRPLLDAIERDRCAARWRPDLMSLYINRPHTRNKDMFTATVRALVNKGWAPLTSSNRAALKHLRAQRLVVSCPARARVKIAPGLDLSAFRPRRISGL